MADRFFSQGPARQKILSHTVAQNDGKKRGRSRRWEGRSRAATNLRQLRALQIVLQICDLELVDGAVLDGALHVYHPDKNQPFSPLSTEDQVVNRLSRHRSLTGSNGGRDAGGGERERRGMEGADSRSLLLVPDQG